MDSLVEARFHALRIKRAKRVASEALRRLDASHDEKGSSEADSVRRILHMMGLGSEKSDLWSMHSARSMHGCDLSVRL